MDARFTGTDSSFATVGTAGVTFYVDEVTNFLGPLSYKNYEKRGGYYGSAGFRAEGVVATAVTSFEKKNECVVGTALGDITLWKGRNCTQLISAHTGAVTALSYSAKTGLLASGGNDCTIRLFNIAFTNSTGSRNRGPQMLEERVLQIVGSIDLLTLGPGLTLGVKSLCVHSSGLKLLLGTSGGELRELICDIQLKPREREAKIKVEEASSEEKKGEEGETEDAPAEPLSEEEQEALAREAELLALSKKGKLLGDDINGGAIVTSHWLGGTGTAVGGVIKCQTGGFISTGGDGTIRLWQTSEGSPQMGLKLFKIPGAQPNSIYKIAANDQYVAVAGPKGVIFILALPSLDLVYEYKNEKKIDSRSDVWAREIKFSPDGLTLVVSDIDRTVSIYSVNPSALNSQGSSQPVDEETGEPLLVVSSDQMLSLRDSFKADIDTFDFTTDGMYIRATNSARTAMSVRTLVAVAALPQEPMAAVEATEEELDEEGNLIISPPPVVPPMIDNEGTPAGIELEDSTGDLFRSLTFASSSVPCSWDLKGVWSSHTAEPIQACDKNEALFVCANVLGSLVLTRYPAPMFSPGTVGVPKNQRHLAAHSGLISSLIFIEEGAKMITAGVDGVIIVWKVTPDTEGCDNMEMGTLPALKKVGDGEEEEEAEPAVEEEVAEEEPEEEEEEELDDDGNPIPRPPVLYDSGEDDDLFDGRRMKSHLTKEKKRVRHGRTDRLSAVTPWAGQVGILDLDPYGTDPSSVTPSESLKLQWVHGYNSRITRGAVRYSPEGLIIYPAATMGVLLDKVTRTQTHSMVHCDEITCLDVYTPTGIASTGHKGTGDIFVCVWSPTDGQILRRLNCGSVNGVSAVCFSPDGSLLAVAVQNENHSIMLFDWKKGFLRSTTDGGRQKVLGLTFSLMPPPPLREDSVPVVLPLSKLSMFPTANSMVAAIEIPVRILQAGVAHFSFLELTSEVGISTGAGGRTLVSKPGSFGDAKKNNCLCVASLPPTADGEGGDEFIMGMSDGTLGIIAKGEKAARFTPVQKGAVTSVCVVIMSKEDVVGEEEEMLFKVVTGGTLGIIKVLDQTFEPLSEFYLYKLPELYGNLHPLGKVRGIKSVCVDRYKRKILYGTAGGEIGEIDFLTGKDLNPLTGPLVRTHFRDELHALCAHPIRQECLTAGDDKTLRIWNMDTATQVTSLDLPDVCRAACFSPNGHLIAVGLGGTVRGLNRPSPRPFDGHVVIVSYLQGVLNIVHRATDSTHSITSVAFSPDGAKLYSTSLDGIVYVYDALENFKLITKLYGHTESIVSLDILREGAYVVTYGVKGEVIVWNTATNAMLEEPQKIDVLMSAYDTPSAWNLRQGTFGADSIGSFPVGGSANEVLTLCKSYDHSMMLTGTQTGAIQLRSYPSKRIDSPFKGYSGHSAGGVGKVVFSHNDKYVMSVGRDDRVLLQWKVIKGTPSSAPFNPSPIARTANPAVRYEAMAKHRSTSDVEAAVKAVESSFTLYSVDMAVSPIAENKPIAADLAAGVSIGNVMTKSAAQCHPFAEYSGSGDIITGMGRTLTSISATDRVAQRHFQLLLPGTLRADEVGMIATSPCSQYLLVSTRCSLPLLKGGAHTSLCVFSATGGSLISVLSSTLPGEVTSLSFSQSSRMAVCLCNDSHHQMSVFSSPKGGWGDAEVVHSVSTGEEDVSLVAFMFQESYAYTSRCSAVGDSDDSSDLPDSECCDIVTGGAAPIRFWGLKGRNIVCKYGAYGSDSTYVLTSMTSLKGVVGIVAGDDSGVLRQWSSPSVVNYLSSSHTGAVTVVKSYEGGFVSIGGDRIMFWNNFFDSSYAPVYFENLMTSSALSRIPRIEGTSPVVVSASTDLTCRRLLLTLASSTLIEISVEAGTASVLYEGISAKVTALKASPTETNVIVTGDKDSFLKVWDITPSNRGVLFSVLLPSPATAINFHGADGNIVVAIEATPNRRAALMFFNLSPETAETPKGLAGMPWMTIQDASEKGNIHCLAVSPNSTYIAAGCDAGMMRLFNVTDASLMCRFQALDPNLGPVVAIDFSTDSKFVRVSSAPPLSFDVHGKIEVKIYNIQVDVTAGKNNTTSMAPLEQSSDRQLRSLIGYSWASVSSPSAPEARGVTTVAPLLTSTSNNLEKFGRRVSSVTSHHYPETFSVSLLNEEETVKSITKMITVPDAPSAAKNIAAYILQDKADSALVLTRKLILKLTEFQQSYPLDRAQALKGVLTEQGMARAVGQGSSVITAGYSDGTVELFRSFEDSSVAKLSAHTYGPVLTAITAGGQLCTVGEEDGAILVYDISV